MSWDWEKLKEQQRFRSGGGGPPPMDEIVDRFKKFKRLQVSIDVGKPFKIPNLPAGNRDEFLKQYTDEIMCQIAALLPPSYRGIYQDHPRLTEILASSNTAIEQ